MTHEGDRFSELMEHRRWIDSCKQSASRDRDKTTLMLAGGSMAISVGFLERVVPVVAQSWNALLFCAWLCEIGAMLAILWSMRSSETSFEAEIYRTDHMLRTPGHEDPGWPNPSGKTTEALNAYAPFLAVAGLVLMLVHAGIALNSFATAKETPMSNSKNIAAIHIAHRPTTAGQTPTVPPPARPQPTKK